MANYSTPPRSRRPSSAAHLRLTFGLSGVSCARKSATTGLVQASDESPERKPTVRWKYLSVLIAISVIWPACSFAQSRPAAAQSPAAKSQASPAYATSVRAFGTAPPAKSAVQGAKPNGAGAPIDPQLKADILHLFAVMDLEQALERSAQARMGSLRPGFLKMLPDTPHREQIADEAVRNFQAMITSPAFEDSLVAVYAKYLNDEQVKGLIQIYQSPAWQHYEDVQGSLKASVRQAGAQFAFKSMPTIFAGLCSDYPELRGKGIFCPATSAPKGKQ